MESDELFAAFAEKYGIDGLDFAEGAMLLEIDGMSVAVASDDEAGEIVVSGEIGEMPPDGAVEFSGMLLQANADCQGMDGAVFAQDAETKTYILLKRIAVDGALDLDGFSDMLEKFVNKLETWRKLLVDFRPAAAEATAAAAGEPNSLFGGMMV